MRLVFFGTPGFAVPSLNSLLASPHPVVGVVTQPDRRRGRGQKVSPEAVKAAASARNLAISQPERPADERFLAEMSALAPDLAVVAAYGRILSSRLLGIPRLGFINVHASLLPRWRGAAPVHRAILAGDKTTGVTIMRVVKELDAGPIMAVASTAVDPNETSVELENRLATIGAGLLRSVVDRIAAGDQTGTPQDEQLVTYAARLERGESRLDWAKSADTIHNQIRGLQPWPLAAARLRDRRVLFLRSEVASIADGGGVPGQILSVAPDLIVAASPGQVRIQELQVEGRQKITSADFVHGYRVVPGDRFEPLPDV